MLKISELGNFCSGIGSKINTNGQITILDMAKNHTVLDKGGMLQAIDFNPILPKAQLIAAEIMINGPTGSLISKVKSSDARTANPIIATIRARSNFLLSFSPKYTVAKIAVIDGIVYAIKTAFEVSTKSWPKVVKTLKPNINNKPTTAVGTRSCLSKRKGCLKNIATMKSVDAAVVNETARIVRGGISLNKNLTAGQLRPQNTPIRTNALSFLSKFPIPTLDNC